jgi:hypothetical protein
MVDLAWNSYPELASTIAGRLSFEQVGVASAGGAERSLRARRLHLDAGALSHPATTAAQPLRAPDSHSTLSNADQWI